MRVLLVDDNSDDLRRVREALLQASRSRCQIATAADLAAVFALLHRCEYDIILIDLAPPSGLARLRALQRGIPSMPLVGMTHGGSERDEVQWLREGADDCIEKSEITGRLLLRLLGKTIERRRRVHEPALLEDDE